MGVLHNSPPPRGKVKCLEARDTTIFSLKSYKEKPEIHNIYMIFLVYRSRLNCMPFVIPGEGTDNRPG